MGAFHLAQKTEIPYELPGNTSWGCPEISKILTFHLILIFLAKWKASNMFSPHRKPVNNQRQKVNLSVQNSSGKSARPLCFANQWISRAWVANQSSQKKWIVTGLVYTNAGYSELGKQIRARENAHSLVWHIVTKITPRKLSFHSLAFWVNPIVGPESLVLGYNVVQASDPVYGDAKIQDQLQDAQSVRSAGSIVTQEEEPHDTVWLEQSWSSEKRGCESV